MALRDFSIRSGEGRGAGRAADHAQSASAHEAGPDRSPWPSSGLAELVERPAADGGIDQTWSFSAYFAHASDVEVLLE